MKMSEMPVSTDVVKMIGEEQSEHPLWALLKEYNYDTKPIRGDIKGRAIAHLRTLLKPYIDREVKECGRSDQKNVYPAMVSINRGKIKQLKQLNQVMFDTVWVIAERWLIEDKPSAISYLESQPDADFDEATMKFIMDVTYKLLGNDIDKVFHLIMKKQVSDGNQWMVQRIETAGGKHVVLTYAVAIALFRSLFNSWHIIHGFGRTVETEFVSDQLIEYLKKCEAIWIEPFKSRIALLYSLPRSGLPIYASHLAEMYDVLTFYMDDCRDYAQGILKRSNEQAILLNELNKRNRELEKKLNRLSKMAPEQGQAATANIEVTVPVTNKEIEAANGHIRELKKELERERDSVGRLQSELSDLKEFTQLLLVPDMPLPSQDTVVLSEQEILESHVVFIGGHERLHTKLRKLMPNAQFVHPDQSRFSNDIFKGAQAVVFCSHYCNHTIFGQAVDEVRKSGILAGYTNHNNLDQIMQDVGNILRQARNKS